MLAWLKYGDKWKRTTNTDAILAAEIENSLVGDEYEDVTLAMQELSTRTDKFLSAPSEWEIVETDQQVFKDLTDELRAQLRSGTSVLVHYVTGFQSFTHKRVRYWLSHEPQDRGLVGVELTDGYKVVYDFKLWRTLRRKVKGQAHEALVTKWDMETVGYKLARNLGTSLNNDFVINQFWIWLAAHDAYVGVGKTNKLLRPLAKQWFRNPKKNQKRHTPRMDAKMLKKLVRRLKVAAGLVKVS